jgi:hypothetical protein
MIFDYLNYDNKFKTVVTENEIVITDTSNDKIACDISLFESNKTLQFYLNIYDGYDNVIATAYNELLKYYKTSKCLNLETIISEPDDLILEYLHSHNFEMMSLDDKFKLTYKERSLYDS